MLKYVALVALITVANATVPSGKTSTTETDKKLIAATEKENIMSDKLVITDEKIGDGAEAKAHQLVTVHYTGRLTDGTKFDSSVDRGQPFRFMLGVSQVIKGWDEGVVGMKVGGKRKLVIPSEMAYGKRGAGAVIPPDATLEFDIELLSVEG